MEGLGCCLPELYLGVVDGGFGVLPTRAGSSSC